MYWEMSNKKDTLVTILILAIMAFGTISVGALTFYSFIDGVDVIDHIEKREYVGKLISYEIICNSGHQMNLNFADGSVYHVDWIQPLQTNQYYKVFVSITYYKHAMQIPLTKVTNLEAISQ